MKPRRARSIGERTPSIAGRRSPDSGKALLFLTERAVMKNYASRIGTPNLNLIANPASFNAEHAAGHDAQAEHFQAVFSDPSIMFNYEEKKPNGDATSSSRATTGTTGCPDRPRDQERAFGLRGEDHDGRPMEGTPRVPGRAGNDRGQLMWPIPVWEGDR
jgi:hypothetical protein